MASSQAGAVSGPSAQTHAPTTPARLQVVEVARGPERQRALCAYVAEARTHARRVRHLVLPPPANGRALVASLVAATPTPGGAPLDDASLLPRLQRAFDQPGAIVCVEFDPLTRGHPPDATSVRAWFASITAALQHVTFLVLVDPPAASQGPLPLDVSLLLSALAPAPRPLTARTWTEWLSIVWQELARDPSDAAAQARSVPGLRVGVLDTVERAWDGGHLVDGVAEPDQGTAAAGEPAPAVTFVPAHPAPPDDTPPTRAVLRAAFRCATQRMAQRIEELAAPVDGAEVGRLAALGGRLIEAADCDATTRMLAIAVRATHAAVAPTDDCAAAALREAFDATWPAGMAPPRGSAFAALELVRLSERQRCEDEARALLAVLDRRAGLTTPPGQGTERECLRIAVAGIRVTLALGELRKARARIAALHPRLATADRTTRAWVGTLDAMLALVDDDRDRAAQRLALALADLRALGGRRAALDATLAASVLAERAGAGRVALELLRTAMPDVATLGDPWVRAHVALHAAWRHIASASSASPGDGWLRDAHVAARLTGCAGLLAWVQTLDALEGRVFPDDDTLRVLADPPVPVAPRPTVADLFLRLGGAAPELASETEPVWAQSPWDRLAARRAHQGIEPAARLARARSVPTLRDDDLVVLGAAHQLRLPGGTWVDLTTAPVLARLLEPLLDAHRSARGSTVTTETLIASLWGASDDHEVLVNRLHQAISRLRRAGLRDLVLTSPGGYCLRPDASVIRVDDP